LEELRKDDADFDLILLDLYMPDTPMDGFEALNIVMNDDKLKNIPLVVMSASERNEIISDCLKRGATNFLVKPIRL